MEEITLAVDAMGGDIGPAVIVPAVLSALKEHLHLKIILVGDDAQINAELARVGESDVDPARLILEHTPDAILMDDKPTVALRRKPRSSMHKIVDLVRQGTAHACVSAGNTGALMAIGLFHLKTLPGIDRPAIVASIPTIDGHCYLLDVGANVDCRSEYLYQFAIMGSALAHALDHIPKPTVGLLNIGQEGIKGNEQVKLAAQLLENNPIVNYQGFVEADQLFHRPVDVVVCDGFIGNIALKTCEGMADMMIHWLNEYLKANKFWWRLHQNGVQQMRTAIQKEFNHRRFNGASLIGLQGIVVKSHGKADQNATKYAIEHAMLEVVYDIPRRINQDLEQIF